MEQVRNVAIGGKNFTINEGAYSMLDKWLYSFRLKVEPREQVDDIMREIEERVAELFEENMKSYYNVVDEALTRKVIAQLGMPDGSSPFASFAGASHQGAYTKSESDYAGTPNHKLYRDDDNRIIGGVCSGISLYLDIDTVIVRVIAVILLLFATCGFWIYLILWIIMPMARTPLQKCELRGITPSAENLRKFSKF